MNQMHLSTLLATLSFAGIAFAQQPEQQPQVDPRPQTSETEGTAADTTPPGRTPTRPTQGQANPRPATSPAEGTAADTTPPGRTSTTAGSQAGTAAQQSELVGASVVTPADAEIGTVVDVVFDATGQPAFVVISTQGGEDTAVPYSVANSMMEGDRVVMDQSKLKGAPKVRNSEWRNPSSNDKWQRDATRYWEQG